MKKSFTIIMLTLIASLATAQSTQQPEDLKNISGTEGDINDSMGTFNIGGVRYDVRLQPVEQTEPDQMDVMDVDEVLKLPCGH